MWPSGVIDLLLMKRAHKNLKWEASLIKNVMSDPHVKQLNLQQAEQILINTDLKHAWEVCAGEAETK